jgi:predicted DsbA family dithiol-disulfide isomerase
MRTVTFYHSAICPRCKLSGRWLSQLLADFPDFRVEKIEFLTNQRQAKASGVRFIPTLIAGDKKLSGIVLTKGRIRRFLESL